MAEENARKGCIDMLKQTRLTDPELAKIVDKELDRQEKCIEMIASESTVPVPVMELSGSVFRQADRSLMRWRPLQSREQKSSSVLNM